MPFRDNPQSLRDIRESIDNIALFLGPIDFDGYLKDRKTQAAVERELQIITEAAFRLGEEAQAICPGPDWRNIRGLGNALRHAYDDITTASSGTPYRTISPHSGEPSRAPLHAWSAKSLDTPAIIQSDE